jgi:hypothetical protein
MADQSEERRRKYPRLRESCNVRYRVVEDPVMRPEEQGGVAVNISGGGMCFAADQEIPPGAMIALEIRIGELPTPVMAFGRVVWCEDAGEAGKTDVGVEFWWIGWADAEAQGKMLRYIQEKLDKLGIDNAGAVG